MHYDDHTFSISANCPSMFKRQGDDLVPFNASGSLSARDIAGINAMF